jgi:hypothetical protein
VCKYTNVGVVTVDLFPLDKKLVDLLRVGGINLSKDPARLFLALLQEASFELVLNTDFDRDRDSFFGRGICEELLERFNILDINKFTLKAVFTQTF